jgi:hypothetical protein
MHTTARRAINESFKYRDIVFSFLVKAISHEPHLHNAEVVPNDLCFWGCSNNIIFNGIHVVGPTRNSGGIRTNGDFRAVLVVFNQQSASCRQKGALPPAGAGI